MKTVLSVVLLLVSVLAFGEDDANSSNQAKAYDSSEFPEWVLQTRRAEIVAVGSFPIVYVFAAASFDYFYYASTGFSASARPWPFGSGTSDWSGTDLQNKNLSMIGASLALCAVVAGIDWFLGLEK